MPLGAPSIAGPGAVIALAPNHAGANRCWRLTASKQPAEEAAAAFVQHRLGGLGLDLAGKLDLGLQFIEPALQDIDLVLQVVDLGLELGIVGRGCVLSLVVFLGLLRNAVTIDAKQLGGIDGVAAIIGPPGRKSAILDRSQDRRLARSNVVRGLSQTQLRHGASCIIVVQNGILPILAMVTIDTCPQLLPRSHRDQRCRQQGRLSNLNHGDV